MLWPGVIEYYKEFLPVNQKTPVITLKEGNTPLIQADKLSSAYFKKGINLFLKYEGLNPTGSFKDRGMTLAISKAKEEGSQAVICASTGNTSASAAAYAAQAEMRCVVLIPQGAIALGKLAQAMIHGAQVLAIEGNFDQALSLVRKITEKHPLTLVNSLNPNRLEGQKTAAFEICDHLGTSPDFQAMPVGNAGNITAYWKGYKEYFNQGRIKSLPKLLGFQAAGSAPIVEKRVIENPKTMATAIRIGNPASWRQAEAARDESGGLIDKVSDEEILEAYKLLAVFEGVFVEPASAASLAGIIKLNKKQFFARGASPLGRKPNVVCILTGHGLKDPDRAIKTIEKPELVPARVEKIIEKIGIDK